MRYREVYYFRIDGKDDSYYVFSEGTWAGIIFMISRDVPGTFDVHDQITPNYPVKEIEDVREFAKLLDEFGFDLAMISHDRYAAVNRSTGTIYAPSYGGLPFKGSVQEFLSFALMPPRIYDRPPHILEYIAVKHGDTLDKFVHDECDGTEYYSVTTDYIVIRTKDDTRYMYYIYSD